MGAWLRRRTGVELVGPPGRFFAWPTIALSLMTIVYAGAWNVQHYPILLGYDAQAHADYAHVLLREHDLPTPAESGSLKARRSSATSWVASVTLVYEAERVILA